MIKLQIPLEIKEPGGFQDQIAVTYGGFNKILFSREGFEVTPLNISKERIVELNSKLMLFYTGLDRYAYKIENEKNGRINDNLSLLNELKKYAQIGIEILESEEDLCQFGLLLHKSWLIKKRLSRNVSSSRIDEMYETAINAGAIGGKILGAGGGGFLLIFSEPTYQENIKESLRDYLNVPFKFETEGSSIIFNNESGIKL